MQEEQGTSQLRIRIPEGLRTRVEASAEAQFRSVNGEYAARLESSFKVEDLRRQIRSLTAEVDQLNAELEERKDALTEIEATRHRDNAEWRNTLAQFARSQDDSREALNSLTDTIESRANNENEIYSILQYLSSDATFMHAEYTKWSLTKVVAAPPLAPVKSPLASALRNVIDVRTRHVVRLALHMAGINKPDAIVKQIESDHSIERDNKMPSMDTAREIEQ